MKNGKLQTAMPGSGEGHRHIDRTNPNSGRVACQGGMTVNFDGIWDFSFSEKGILEKLDPKKFKFNDVMNVPGCFDCQPEYYSKRGIALYRTSFELEEPMRDSVLHVGGLGLRGRIWIDQREIAYDNEPYCPQKYVAGALKAGVHTLTVAIDNRFDPEKMKLFLPHFDFYAFGGIYRSMHLDSVTPGYHLDRVQIRTVDLQQGEVRLTFLFTGKMPAKIRAKIRFDTEKDYKGIELSVKKGKAEIRCKVPDFKIWSPEEPNLHKLYVRTTCGNLIETFGIRTIAAAGTQILLNGKPIRLKGFNRHESHPDSGAATNEAVMIKDLEHLKQLHCNFIRGCHYQQDQKFLDLCDRMGFLVWEESLGWQPPNLADKEFCDLQEDQTRKMVRESINHPSVIFWAFMNEFNSSSQEGYALAKRLVKSIKKEDDSRLVTFACSWVNNDICVPLMDVIAYNTYPGWCGSPEDCCSMPTENIVKNQRKILKRFRSYCKGKPILVSEMGTCAVYGQHDEAGAQWTEEFQAVYLTAILKAVLGDQTICGISLWQLNDAKSYLLSGAPIRSKPFAQNLAGAFDQYRRRKLAADVVRKYYSEN